MATMNRNEVSEFPYTGTFSYDNIDDTGSLIEQTATETTACTVNCDIQEASHQRGQGVISASYEVYFRRSSINITNGMHFSSTFNGLAINGVVIGVFPSQLGDGVKVYIQDMDV